MKPEFLEKTWLGFAGGLAVALIAVLVVKFSAGTPKVEEVYIVNPARVNVNYPVPAAEEAPPFASEAAPMPPFPVADPDEGADKAEMPLKPPSA
jgi:hypothetical protein